MRRWGVFFAAGAFALSHAREISLERKKVNAAGIRSVGYDPREQCLEVELGDGRIVQFLRVPAEVHRRLLAAPSIMSYYRDQIEDEYSRRTVR